MVGLEAEMVAAMDDILEPQQQQKVEAKRQEKERTAASKTLANSTNADKKAKQTAQRKGDASTANTQPSKEAAKESTGKKADSSKTADSSKSPAADTNSDGKTDADETIVWTMVIVPVQDEYRVCEMSDAQTMQCDKVCQSYHKELVQLHRLV